MKFLLLSASSWREDNDDTYSASSEDIKLRASCWKAFRFIRHAIPTRKEQTKEGNLIGPPLFEKLNSRETK
jgi:hypothetical protein